MSYKLLIHRNVIRFLKLQKTNQKRLIQDKIDLLQKNPFNTKELVIKKMIGIENTYRLRIGSIRIIYTIFEEQLLIILITAGNRGDVYK